MSILVGDITDNGNVGSADVGQVQAQVGQPVMVVNSVKRRASFMMASSTATM